MRSIAIPLRRAARMSGTSSEASGSTMSSSGHADHGVGGAAQQPLRFLVDVRHAQVGVDDVDALAHRFEHVVAALDRVVRGGCARGAPPYGCAATRHAARRERDAGERAGAAGGGRHASPRERAASQKRVARRDAERRVDVSIWRSMR